MLLESFIEEITRRYGNSSYGHDYQFVEKKDRAEYQRLLKRWLMLREVQKDIYREFDIGELKQAINGTKIDIEFAKTKAAKTRYAKKLKKLQTNPGLEEYRELQYSIDKLAHSLANILKRSTKISYHTSGRGPKLHPDLVKLDKIIDKIKG